MKHDKSGTITLGSNSGFSGVFRETGWLGANGNIAPAIEMIDNARTIYQKIIELQK